MEKESIIIGMDIGIRLPRVKDGSVIFGGAAGFSMSRARDFPERHSSPLSRRRHSPNSLYLIQCLQGSYHFPFHGYFLFRDLFPLSFHRLDA